MQTNTILVAEDVRRLMLAARTKAEECGFEVSIAIVDAAGVLLALERLDGARFHTPEVAPLKARTAAITRVPSRELQKQVHENLEMLAFPGRLPVAGGLPIIHDGAVIGGVGCSGGTPEQDETVCDAAIAAFASLAPGGSS